MVILTEEQQMNQIFIFIEENLCNIDLPELFDVNRVNIIEELNIPVNRN